MDKWLNFTASGDSLIVKHIPQGYPGFDKVKEFLYREMRESQISKLH